MAQDNTLGGLYLSVGLDISELESDFLAADRTTRENLNRLNRESNLVRLRAEVEIGNLDETADAVQILTVRENALNQQMAMQRDRIRIAEAQLQRLTQQHGESAVVTQRAATALERERLSLQRLQRELHDVQDAQSNLNDTQGNSNSIFSSLTDNLDDIAGKAAPVVAAIGAMETAFTAMADAQTRLIENFRELQNQSYELNMPVADTKNFLREMRLAGGDIGDFEGYIRGITDAYVKGEFDDPEFIALSKYGAKITDATGRLKNFKEITEEVYQAYQKAKAAGEGMEFLQLTGGEAGIRDAIQYFERYKEAKEDAAKIFDSGINPTELHESERALNLLTEQTNEFQDALANVITPLAQDAMKELFEIVRDGTQILVENKEEFKSWGFIASEAISTVANAAKEISESEGYKILKKGFDFAGDNLLPSGVLKNNLDMFGNSLIGANGLFGDTWAGIIDRAKDKQIAYNDALNATKASWADFRREVESDNLQSNPLNQYDTKRITQFRDELEDLRLELKYADDEFALATAQNDLWMERELTRKNFLSPEEETAIRELHAEKQVEIERRKAEEIQKIEEDTQNRIKSLTEDTADIEFELTHTAFEKQLRDIEKWKEAQLEKSESAEEAAAIVANAAAKETEALEREVERIKGLTQSLEDEIFEMEHSGYESDKRRAMQKAQKALDEGVDPALVQRWLTAKNGEIDKKARASMRSGGDYVKSPDDENSGFYVVNFNKADPQRDVLRTNENAIRARLINQLSDESALRQLNNQQLANSTNEMINAQTQLNNQIGKGIAIIEGDQVRYGGGDLGGSDNMQTYVRSREEILRDLPEIQRELEEGLRNGSIQKVDDTLYSAGDGYGGYVHNYIQSLEELGATTREAFAKLDEINTSIRETAVEPTRNQQAPNMTVSPTINVDLGGAYVFDDQLKNQLTDDITESVTNAITDTFNKEVRSTSYSYGN